MNEINTGYRVIIIGGDHYNTYGVVRSLGEEGIKSDVYILGCSNKSFVLQSRYVERGLDCHAHKDLVDSLTSINEENIKRVVICCSDEAEEFVLHNYDILSPNYILPVCTDYSYTYRLMNKGTITDLAKQFGIAVPETWRVINRVIPDGISFPCITKPITSTSGHKKDIVVCRNINELQVVVYDNGRCADYVVQEYIDSDREVSVLGAVLANGDVIFSGCIEKLRTCMIGTTSFGMMVNNGILGDNVSKLEALMKFSGYRGLFSAEFLVKDGLFYFLEVNFRNDGNSYVATASGLNLPLHYVQSCLKSETKRKATVSPCYFMLDIEDILTLRRKRIPLWRWLEDLKRTDTFLVYNKQDIKPFFRKTMNVLSSVVKRAWHKLV